jgi:GTP cyclohydrolase III
MRAIGKRTGSHKDEERKEASSAKSVHSTESDETTQSHLDREFIVDDESDDNSGLDSEYIDH